MNIKANWVSEVTKNASGERVYYSYEKHASYSFLHLNILQQQVQTCVPRRSSFLLA
jgi:hypothetical protein